MDGSVGPVIAPLIKVEETRHSTVGASSTDRWMHCTGSNNLIRKIRETTPEKLRRSSSEAALGTSAHTIGQMCLDSGDDAWMHMGTKIKVDTWTFEVDKEMADSVQMYANYVRGLMVQYKEHDPVLYVEHGMGTVLDEDAWGTADVMIHVRALKLLIVIDLKNGMVTVEPDSSQLKYYAALGIENLPGGDTIEDVINVIVQPRMPHPKGRIRKHSTTSSEIMRWFENEAIVKMAETRKQDAPLTIGPWCRFCDARDACPAMKNELSGFDIGAEPDALSDDELGEFLVKGDIIRRQLDRMQEEALRRALNGSKVKFHKLVKKQANRVFKGEMVITNQDGTKSTITAEAAARAKWGAEAFTTSTLKSPAQIEDKLDGGKGFVSTWAFTPDSGMTIAHESDKRDEFRPLIQRLDEAVAEDRLKGVDIG